MATVVFSLAGLSASYIRGGMHGGRDAHGIGKVGMGMPGPDGIRQDPTVPPSLTRIPASLGARRLPPHSSANVGLRFLTVPDAMLSDPEEAAVDRAIGNIWGCLSAGQAHRSGRNATAASAFTGR